MQNEKSPIHIIGAGLAGSEAAWTIANAGIKVILHEMRPKKTSPAHKTDLFAELVCSNSFRSDDPYTNAVGLLHQEMRLAGSLIMKCADDNQVPAGGALAVNRDQFAYEVTEKIKNHPNITIVNEEITTIPPEEWKHVIIATGPLTSESLAHAIQQQTGLKALSFYDAIAPIIYTETINMDICWFQSRYDKVGPNGTGKDYINCPMDKQQYKNFVDALLSGEKTTFHSFEKETYFDGCLPIEIMAERGFDTLRHGPMKPRGLTNAHQPDIKPYAVVQLRQDNLLATLYNMVGFQTKLKHNAQLEVFRTIPGLENAKFARLGTIHRNTYLDAPNVLDQKLKMKKIPHLRFAGQITGCEGYVESAAMGLLAALYAIEEYKHKTLTELPKTTAFGALLNHLTQGHVSATQEKNKIKFQPMNINFGLFPPIEDHSLAKGKERNKRKRQILAERALNDFENWLKDNSLSNNS